MRIGIDVRCLAQNKNTGVEEYTKNLLKAIFEADHENAYVLFFNAYKKNVVDLSWALTYDNVTVKKYGIPNKLLNFLLWFFRFPTIDKLCGGLDAFFMPNSNFVALSPHVKLFFTVHDLSFVHYKKSFSIKRRFWHYFVNPRLLIKKSTHIFAVSESTKKDISSMYDIDEKIISVTPNGPTTLVGKLSRNSMELVDVKEKYALPYKFILYFGTIEPRKNIMSIITAYDVLRKNDQGFVHKLVIAGATGWKSREILDAIKTAEYVHDIILIFDISENEKEALYKLASVFVYPSFFEGFGFPPLEALICGTPVIVSHTTSLPEVVGKYGIMVDPFRQDELIDALHEVINGQLAKNNYQTEACTRHARSFTWRKAADKIIYAFS